MQSSLQAESAVARKRLQGTIYFTPPIVGPSGASLVAYTWKWKPFEYIDNFGEDRVGKMSDWDNSEVNPETGREIVHQFMIKQPGRGDAIVSSESALEILGFSSREDAKPTKNAISVAKTVARLEMQLHEARAGHTAFETDLARILAMTPPKPVPTDKPLRFGKKTWAMGNATRLIDGAAPESTDLRMMHSEWIQDHLRAAGWGSGISGYVYGPWKDSKNHNPFADKIDGIERRLARAKEKLAAVPDLSADQPSSAPSERMRSAP